MASVRTRVIEDPPLAGTVNMARDEALMLCVEGGQSPPTLRFYQWEPPTISLGYFQKYADYESLPSPAGDLAVVRRLTGGGAILHDRELTYALVLPLGHVLLEAGPNALYELVHDTLIDLLAERRVPATRGGASDGSGAAKGPFFCFARRHALDVLLGADKLAGSAQRRTRHAVLQHGSIILERRFEQQPTAMVNARTSLTAGELARALRGVLHRRTGLEFDRGQWHNKELAVAGDLVDKYAGDNWTKRV